MRCPGLIIKFGGPYTKVKGREIEVQSSPDEDRQKERRKERRMAERGRTMVSERRMD